MTKPIGISGRKCYGHLRWFLPTFYKARKIHGTVVLQTRRLFSKTSKWEYEKFGPSPFMEYLSLFLIFETLQSCIAFRLTQMARKDFVGLTLPVPQVP